MESAGYGASVIEDPRRADQEREEREQAHYSQLLRTPATAWASARR